MASGRADYWIRTAPIKVSTSINQTFWVRSAYATLLPGYSTYVINYICPSGYKLVITGGHISCILPNISTFQVVVFNEEMGYIHFNQIYTLPHDSGGLYELAANRDIKVFIQNGDNVTTTFRVTLYGFLEIV